MAWTTPLTGTTELMIDAAIWNTYIRDNQNHLHGRLGSDFYPSTVRYDTGGPSYAASPDTVVGTLVPMVYTNGTGQYSFARWRVPDDFAAIDTMVFLYLVAATGSRTIECVASYGALGQNYNAHTATISSGSVSHPSTTTWYGMDISSAFPNIAPGDICNIRTRYTAGSNYLYHFGVFFAWERT